MTIKKRDCHGNKLPRNDYKKKEIATATSCLAMTIKKREIATATSCLAMTIKKRDCHGNKLPRNDYKKKRLPRLAGKPRNDYKKKRDCRGGNALAVTCKI